MHIRETERQEEKLNILEDEEPNTEHMHGALGGQRGPRTGQWSSSEMNREEEVRKREGEINI